jgi:hypothetical protein
LAPLFFGNKKNASVLTTEALRRGSTLIRPIG